MVSAPRRPAPARHPPGPPRILRGRARTQAAVAAVAGLLALAVTALLVVSGRVGALDERLSIHFGSDDLDTLLRAQELLELSGSSLAMGLAVATATRLAWYRWRHPLTAALPALAAVSSVVVADHVLKRIVASTWPSGSVAGVAALGTISTLLLGAHADRFARGAALCTVAAIGAIAVALLISRDHLFSDIVGGAVLGVTLPIAWALAHDLVTGDGALREDPDAQR